MSDDQGPLPQRIYGWKSLADVLGRSMSWCKRRARNQRHPLPVHHDERSVFCDVEDLRVWLLAYKSRVCRCERPRPAARTHPPRCRRCSKVVEAAWVIRSPR